MNFLGKLKLGLSRSSSKLQDGIGGIFTKARPDAESISALEELLIEADMGARVAAELSSALAHERFDKETNAQKVREFLAGLITDILKPLAVPLVPDPKVKPCIILVVGVNGNGKTTTIGKLAHHYTQQGKKVMLAAADTFRAAAVEQLQVWGERVHIPVVTGPAESDPASVAFRAVEKAKAEKIDVLLIDTAGRLHNKSNLMGELHKIHNVIQKAEVGAPHHVIQVLDATTGQNAIAQVQAFKEMVNVTGLIITKLDGTAKGGIVVALAKQFNLPIHAVGIGEGIDDLDAFEAADFARNLLANQA